MNTDAESTYHDSLCFGMWRELYFSGKLLFKIVSLKEFNDSLKLSVLLFDKVSLSFFSLHILRLSFLIACSTIEIFRSSCFAQSFDISLQFKALITRSRLALPFPMYPDIDMIGNKELVFISVSILIKCFNLHHSCNQKYPDLGSQILIYFELCRRGFKTYSFTKINLFVAKGAYSDLYQMTTSHDTFTARQRTDN